MDALQQLNSLGSPGFGFSPGLSAFSPGAAGARCLGGCCGMQNPFQMMMMQNQMLTQLMGMLMQLMSPPANALGGSSPSSLGGSSPASTGGGSSSPASTGSSSGAGSGAVDASQFQGGTETGRRLAAEAQKEATNGDSSGGWCFRDAGRALAKVGINTSGASAYMAADQLAKNPKVKEIKVAQSDLPKLPPGAIVVWDKGPGHPHGHISIALGNGKEASDLLRNQITNYGTSFRVFMPI